MAKKSEAPEWAIYDNPHSKYYFDYDDLKTTPEFQALPVAQRYFYSVLRSAQHNDKNHTCLLLHIREDLEAEGADEPTITQALKEKGSYDAGYFTFPAKAAERYGYSRSTACNLIKGLIKAGFVEKVEGNAHRRKVNVYRFSTAWKSKKYRREAREYKEKH